MIWCIGEEIKHNPKIREKLSVVFLEDYRVTLSEILMPAAEVSEHKDTWTLLEVEHEKL